MPNRNSLGLFVRKIFLSAFVVLTFLAYVLHEHLTAATQTDASGTPTASNDNGTGAVGENNARASSVDEAVAGASDTDGTPPQLDPVSVNISATETPAPTATAQSEANALYRDGTYTGSEADAYFGMVQVQAVIQNGKITDVSFLEYPDHRRTSVRINSQAIPWLQQEAIQAQSAQVDIVSGATLTSEAFMASLQTALDSARN